MVDQHEALAFVLRSSSTERLPKKKKKLQCGTCSPSTGLAEFCPKELLNRLRNLITSWIPVWRKSQIFRLHLTDYFVPFNFRIRAFGKLQSCSPLINFTAQLESSRLDIWTEIYAKNTNWCAIWNPNPNWTWIWCKFPLIPCSSWT